MSFLRELLTQPDENSRFIFLVHGLVTAAALLLLSVVFVFAHDRTGFPTMAAAVSGGGIGAALGRYFTKKGNSVDDDTAK